MFWYCWWKGVLFLTDREKYIRKRAAVWSRTTRPVSHCRTAKREWSRLRRKTGCVRSARPNSPRLINRPYWYGMAALDPIPVNIPKQGLYRTCIGKPVQTVQDLYGQALKHNRACTYTTQSFLNDLNRQDPRKNYSLVPNNQNAHNGVFPHSTPRARGQVPERCIFLCSKVFINHFYQMKASPEC